jgi:hypothetical protein
MKDHRTEGCLLSIKHEKEYYDGKKEKKEDTEATKNPTKADSTGVKKEVQVPFARHDSRRHTGSHRSLFSVSGKQTTNTIPSSCRIEKGENQPSGEKTDTVSTKVYREDQKRLQDSSRDTGGARSALLLLPLPKKLRP